MQDVTKEIDAESSALALRSSGGATGHKGHQETTIDWGLPYSVSPFPPTQNVKMVLRDSGTMTIAASYYTTGVTALQWRLNSIFDVQKTYTYANVDPVAASGPTSDAPDGTTIVPSYRNFYRNFYNYWTVLGTKYVFKYYNATGLTGNNNPCGMDIYFYEHGLQNPPLITPTSTGFVSHNYRMMHPNMKKMDRVLAYGLHGATVDYNTTNPKQFERTHTGYWNATSINHEVAEDELQQTWHKMDEVPPTPNLLTVVVQQMNNGTLLAQSLKYELTIEYIVQLKDLKAQHQYVTAESAIPAIIEYAAPFNSAT